jgi:cyclohexadienyl dehydratase
MSGDYAPFCVCHEASRDCEGFEVEVAHRLAVDLKVRLEIVRFRWPELRQDVEAEKFDIAMSGVTMRPERLFFAAFSHPYAAAGAVVLVADKVRFPSIKTLNQDGVRLAVNAGGHLEQVARAQFGKAMVLPFLKNMELPVLVETQQAEALLTDAFEAPQFLARHERLSALPAFGRDRKAYLLHQSDEQLQDWLNSWLLDRERDGFLPGLRQRWLGEDHAQPIALLSPVFALLDLRLVLMPAVADYKQRYSLPVEDLTQEAAVVERAATLARENKLDPETLRELFRVQIELAKQVQQWALRDPEHIPRWAKGLHLTSEIRPLLSRISNQIIKILAHTSSSVPQDKVIQLAEEEIVTEGVTSEGKQRLGRAVWRIITKRAP